MMRAVSLALPAVFTELDARKQIGSLIRARVALCRQPEMGPQTFSQTTDTQTGWLRTRDSIGAKDTSRHMSTTIRHTGLMERSNPPSWCAWSFPIAGTHSDNPMCGKKLTNWFCPHYVLRICGMLEWWHGDLWPTPNRGLVLHGLGH